MTIIIDRPALTATGLRRSYGDTVAVDSIHLSLTQDLRASRAERRREDHDRADQSTLIGADAIARSSVPDRQGDT